MAKFNIMRSKDDGWYFTLVARNGKTIATSEVYQTRQACYKGITSVQRNAPIADIMERGTEKYEHSMACISCNWVGHETKAIKHALSDEYDCPKCGCLSIPEMI